VDSSPFWEFSLSFYAREGVAPACLQLQDEGGADVNVLLYLLFLAQSRRIVSGQEAQRLDAAVAPWRDSVVRPLRGLRRHLKEDTGAVPPPEREAFRNRVKKLELEAERLQQMALEREGQTLRLETVATREEAAQRNLNAYSAILGGLAENPLKTVLKAFTLLPPSYRREDGI
jgi:uncharacterized protein (TIGR02444 family)